MSFVSYAQNFEDVMLYRALKHVENGFYIDVGAWHPVSDSVTKAFYERGWRGINIEPDGEYFSLLAADRPRDVNLNAAVGAYQGEITFYEVEHTGLSTVDQVLAEQAAGPAGALRSYTVPCTTLATVCAQYEVDQVHFLKIDVEGAEKAVLEGFAFEAVRPWIVVIEANKPNSTEDASHEWEHIILARGYDFVYYDGLNRFYLAKEQAVLRDSFGSPPNVFDNYVLYPHLSAIQSAEERLAELAHHRDQLNNLLDQALTERDAANRALAERAAVCNALQQALANERAGRESLAGQLQEILNSRSWRLTSPLRGGKDRAMARVKRSLRVILRCEQLRRVGGRLVPPGVKAGLRRLAGRGQAWPVAEQLPQPLGPEESLTEPARAVYYALRDRNDGIRAD